MTITELIQKLKLIKDKCGDMDVEIEVQSESIGGPISTVEVVDSTELNGKPIDNIKVKRTILWLE